MRMTFETGRPVPELPFRVVVLGPFAAAGGASPPAAPLRVDGGNFDETLQAVAGSLMIQPPGSAATVRLQFESLKSFRPEAIARQLPDGAARLAAREILLGLKAKRLNRAEAVKRLEAAPLPGALREGLVAVLRGGAEVTGAPSIAPEAAATKGAAPPSPAPAPPATPPRAETPAPPAPAEPAPRPPVDEPLGGLLSMVDLPGAETGPGGSGAPPPNRHPGRSLIPEQPVAPDPAMAALSAAIGAMARSTGPVTRSDTEAAAAALAGLDAGLADQVHAVLRDPGFRRLEAAWRGLRFLVSRVDFRAGVIVEIVPTPPGGIESALRGLARAGADGTGGEPVSLALVIDDIPVSVTDLTRLEALADLAGALGAPILLAVPRDTADELAATAAWAAFRQRGGAEWLGLALNAFLARPLYGPDSEPVREIDFSEGSAEALWGSPAWGMTVAAARSFARHGWPTHIEGADGVIEDLPIRPVERGLLPLQDMMGPDEAARLVAAGFIPLTATWNRDEARILRAPAAGAGAWLAVGLARARLAALVRRSLDEIGPSAAPDDLANHVTRMIGRLMPGSIEWKVDLAMDPADPTARVLKVKIRPGPPILPAPREMELAFQIG